MRRNTFTNLYNPAEGYTQITEILNNPWMYVMYMYIQYSLFNISSALSGVWRMMIGGVNRTFILLFIY